ncbi:MAG: allantoate amidohydrolase [Granulosicoccus sp.]|nr:allantoate amidohydrolase [Granulosicoccus sp.]
MHSPSDDVGKRLMQRIDELAMISESSEELTRRFATAEHRRANDQVAHWMAQAGMQVHEDAIGNVIGRYEGASASAPAIMLGSHLDTVVNAGKYDGMLGVLCALACVESLSARKQRLPQSIEVIGFADEEGVRYHTTFLGSRAVANQFDYQQLDRLDKDGIRMRDALMSFGKDVNALPQAAREAEHIAAFVEVHIEQGPVLEQADLGVGVVKAIAGATRLIATIDGTAGHAGTVPMTLRCDALAAAAESLLGVEKICSGTTDLVGTVGEILAEPGASNVIPGRATFSIDIRAADDAVRLDAVKRVIDHINTVCQRRQVKLSIDKVHEASSQVCDARLIEHISAAIAEHQPRVLSLSSGAGHDTMVMASLTAAGMIFVRCAGGVSHHPDESITKDDAALAVDVLLQTVLNLSESLPQQAS